jgi:hypothetical protein
LKWIAILAVGYVGIVVAFESLLGVVQPTNDSTLVITTTDGSGEHDRVVSRLESDGKLYVAANHWPRARYDRAIDDPNVAATVDGERGEYLAVPVGGDEHDRVDAANRLPFVFRVLTGFPPRLFLRLDPSGDRATGQPGRAQ